MNIQKQRTSLFALITLLTLIFNLMLPTSALADDETPTPAPTEVVTEETATPLPPTTEAVTESPTPAPTDVTPPPDSTPEPAPVSEVLEQLPENTELVVLDENGEALPLVTTEAEEVIITGDPIWCADGVTPDPTDPNCSPAFANMTGLLGWLAVNNPNQAGTIWIEDSYDSSVNDPALPFVYLDGAALTNMANNSLTVQGGWSGTTDDTTITGTSEFNNMIWITNWNANVTINNIFSTGGFNAGIDVETTGDINLNNITANNNIYGAVLDNCVLNGVPECTGNGDVNLNNVTVNDNVSNGAQVMSNGEINVTNITANNNGNAGFTANNAIFNTAVKDVNINGNNQFNSNGLGGVLIYSDGNVTVNNSEANDNISFNGISVLTLGNITLNNVTANNNYSSGAFNSSLGTGNVFVTNGVFNNNINGSGLEVYSIGNITLNNVTANNNHTNGSHLDNVFGAGNVFVTNGVFNNNINGSGLEVYASGNMTLKNITANGNAPMGIDLYGTGNLSANGIIASNNGAQGLIVFNGGLITISDIVGNNNGYAGAYLFSYGGIGVSNGQFANNAFGGLGAFTTGNIYLENIVSDGHVSGSGLFADGSVTIKCSTFSNNSDSGMQVDTPELNLYGVTFINNGVNIDDTTIGGSTINTFEYNCDPAKKPVGGSGLPLQIAGGNAELDCDNYSGTVLILSNGDKVTFKCPIDGSATLNALTSDALPQELPEGATYVSGMVAIPSPDGSDVALDGLVIVDFIIPQDLQGSNFAILYWDGNEWLDLADVKDAQGTKDAKFEDGRKVFNAGFVTKDGYFEAQTNFSGNFVLVTK